MMMREIMRKKADDAMLQQRHRHDGLLLPRSNVQYCTVRRRSLSGDHPANDEDTIDSIFAPTGSYSAA